MSLTLVQHRTNIIQMFCFDRDGTLEYSLSWTNWIRQIVNEILAACKASPHRRMDSASQGFALAALVDPDPPGFGMIRPAVPGGHQTTTIRRTDPCMPHS